MPDFEQIGEEVMTLLDAKFDSIALASDRGSLAEGMIIGLTFALVIRVAEGEGVPFDDRWGLKRVWGRLSKEMQQQIAPLLTGFANEQHALRLAFANANDTSH